jgi:hypothetical protein
MDNVKPAFISTSARLVSYSMATIGLLSLFACDNPSTTPAEKTQLTIGAILLEPSRYSGQTVTITGEYRGWEGGYGSPPVTRSDWVLKDDTGGIYVTGKTPEGFDPYTSRGREVTVNGVIRIKDNKPYIEAVTVK